MKQTISILALAGIVGWGAVDRVMAQAQPAPAAGARIELTQGSKARYKVAEQLVGVDFGNDAVGTTEAVTGVIVIKADGSIDAAQSKITVDMRTLKSDQELRDMYLHSSVLQTAKFSTLEFVPQRAVGMPFPLPLGTKIPNTNITMPQAAGFKLIGNMTFHGVTTEVTWSVVSTINAENVQGRATTTVQFATFGLTKPQVPLLAKADDNIQLEVEFRGKRTAQ